MKQLSFTRGLLLAGLTLLITPMFGCSGGGAPGGAIAGVWRATYNDPTTGTASVELILQNNGRFQQQTAPGTGGLINLYGTWQTTGDTLRLNIERGEPKQTCGPLGCTDIIYPTGEFLNFGLTGNSLRTTLISCAANPVCTINYTKVPGTG